MKNDDRIKKWVKTWENASSALYSIKIAELQDAKYYPKNREILNNMLQYAFDHHIIRKSSGLVIQQNIFKRYFHRLNNSNEFE